MKFEGIIRKYTLNSLFWLCILLPSVWIMQIMVVIYLIPVGSLECAIMAGTLSTNNTFLTDGYFALGDNRGNSIDSRYWGFVPQVLIVGKATFGLLFKRCIIKTYSRRERIRKVLE